MHEITEQSVLKAFQEEKTLSWDDLTEKEIFCDMVPESERSIQLSKDVKISYPIRDKFCN